MGNPPKREGQLRLEPQKNNRGQDLSSGGHAQPREGGRGESAVKTMGKGPASLTDKDFVDGDSFQAFHLCYILLPMAYPVT